MGEVGEHGRAKRTGKTEAPEGGRARKENGACFEECSKRYDVTEIIFSCCVVLFSSVVGFGLIILLIGEEEEGEGKDERKTNVAPSQRTCE